MIFTRTQNHLEHTIHMLKNFCSMVTEYAGLILSDAQDQAEDTRRNINKATYIDPAYAPARLGLADLLMIEDDPAKAYTLWGISINLIARLPEKTPVEYFKEYPQSPLIDLLKQQLKTGQDVQKGRTQP